MKLPKPPKSQPFVPNTLVTKGTIIQGPNDMAGGWWVVVSDHVTGLHQTPAGLKPGQSNDIYHWSNGPS